MSHDLFGHSQPEVPFKDIRNQRESVAEEKARLCHELNALCKRPPQFLATASVQTVRKWRETHKSATRALANKSASRSDLHSAIEAMKGWLPKESA